MNIAWLGHACFRLWSDDLVMVTDPYPASLGLRPESRPATVVTVSNTHPNHSNLENVGGNPRIIRAPGEYEFSGLSIRGVMTPLAPEKSQESRNVAYTVEMDNVNICHLGDIDVPLTPRQVDDLEPVDVLLAPVGGGCTLEVDQIIQAMQDLDPKIVIPMHYSIPGVDLPLQAAEPFLARMGLGEAQRQPRLSVTRSNLPESMQVVVLAPQARSA